jgi:hypothetical protein
MESLIGKQVRIATNNGEDTLCPISQDNTHCDCWRDGDGCCFCKDPAKLDDTVYTVVQLLDNNKVVIVDDPTDPRIVDTIPESLIKVVDE